MIDGPMSCALCVCQHARAVSAIVVAEALQAAAGTGGRLALAGSGNIHPRVNGSDYESRSVGVGVEVGSEECSTHSGGGKKTALISCGAFIKDE